MAFLFLFSACLPYSIPPKYFLVACGVDFFVINIPVRIFLIKKVSSRSHFKINLVSSFLFLTYESQLNLK